MTTRRERDAVAAQRRKPKHGPDVGVVVTTYDNPDALARALGLLADQTRPPDWIVVADDGSARRSENEAVCRRFGHRVLLRRIEHNAGAARCRDHGLKALLGEVAPTLVCMLDDDDHWPPERLACSTAAMTSDVGMSFGIQVMTDERLQPLMHFPCHTSYASALMHALCFGEFFFPAKTYMFQHRFLQMLKMNNGNFYFDHNAREDIDLGIRALRIGRQHPEWRCVFVDRTLAYWVQPADRAKFFTPNYEQRQRLAHLDLLQAHMPAPVRPLARLTAPWGRRLPDWIKFGLF